MSWRSTLAKLLLEYGPKIVEAIVVERRKKNDAALKAKLVEMTTQKREDASQ